MDKIMAMREKRAEMWEQAKQFLDSHEKDGHLTAEDAKAYEQMENEVLALGKDIERMERQAILDAQLAKPVTAAITNIPGAVLNAEKTGRASEAYHAAMLKALRTNFRQVENVLQEGVDANGGYLVPEEYDQRLIDVLNEENVLRPLATTITTSGEHKINIAATKPAAAWIEEGAALTFGDATFDQIVLDAHKLHVAVKVTEELLYDNAFNLENYLIEQFGKALGNAEEDAFLNGDGTHKPKGLLTSAKTSVTTAAADLKADELVTLVYSLKRPYRKNAAFIVNDQTLASIRKLKDANGAYFWQPSYQMGEPDRLLGYPVYSSAYMPAVEAGKTVIAFGDYSYYNIGD
ncbi:phage major capsid protein, partial [Selenomonas sp. oral taxon 138]|uniref:phage major capsid protein n=1 Tax=Selenomonas sp. oral taxon 138 TaxID=712532 RepID=UPI0002A37930